MRERYESDSDRAREQEMIATVGRLKGWELRKNETPLARIDFDLFVEDRLYAKAELKCRRVRSRAFATFFISKAKFESGLEEAKAAGIRFMVFVRWIDAWGFHIVDPGRSYAVERESGRTTKTRDEWDVESVVHIPIAFFTTYVANWRTT